ncbi:MAG: hypothetical protein U1F36_05730 [Planctomycetota bacterium]
MIARPLRVALVAAALLAGLPAQATAPGLVLTLTPRAPTEGALARDLRIAPALALYVGRDEAPSAFLGEGLFDATFQGELDVPARDDYVFSFTGVGNFTLEIDGEVVLTGPGKGTQPLSSEPKRLRKGRRALLARYRTPLSGLCELRVAWEGKKLPLQSIPPSALFHDPGSEGLADALALHDARMTLATGRCTACHVLPVGTQAVMPELAMRGPSLLDAGARFEQATLARWIADPRSMRRHARMPRVLRGPDSEKEAADIAAFLVTLGADAPLPAIPGDALRGGVLWARLGCFTCHATDAKDQDAWIELSHAAVMYRPAAIADFVARPAARDPFVRMPDLKLVGQEAADLEAFLRSRLPATGGGRSSGDAAHGRELFAARGCANCHDAGVTSTLSARALGDVLRTGAGHGCLSTEDASRGGAPDFGFAVGDAILRALPVDVLLDSLRRDARAEFADRQIEERRCVACHQIGDRTSTWTTREDLVADLLPKPEPVEGKVEVAQNRPPLTVVGEKLRIDWMTRFLRGAAPSPRPWLHARMPRLSDPLAEPLARGLAARHGFGTDPASPSIDRGQVGIGRGLIEAQGGFGCVNCHAVAGRPPAALFEVQGIDFARVAERLRPEYYASWMLDPTRYDAASKMPRFANEDLRTALEPLGGDARAQFGAIWQYLQGADELKEKR